MGLKILLTGLTIMLAVSHFAFGPAAEVVGAFVMIIGAILLWVA